MNYAERMRQLANEWIEDEAMSNFNHDFSSILHDRINICDDEAPEFLGVSDLHINVYDGGLS